MLARQISPSVSLGASAYVAGLNAMDGADLLYGGSDRMVQSGSLRDFRTGLTKEWGERRLDLLLNTSWSEVEQDVHYTIYNWSATWPTTTQRSDQNMDRTVKLGGSAQYVQPFGDEGWRVDGWPRPVGSGIPRSRIPRAEHSADPGSTNAFNLGLGLTRTVGASSFAIDLVEEPCTARRGERRGATRPSPAAGRCTPGDARSTTG